MTVTDWIILIAVIVYVAMAVLAIKFPRGRGDWQKGRTETLYMALSTGVFLMFFFLLWYVSAVVDWPGAITILFWAGLIVLIALVLISVFVPRGIRLTFSDRGKKPSEDEE